MVYKDEILLQFSLTRVSLFRILCPWISTWNSLPHLIKSKILLISQGFSILCPKFIDRHYFASHVWSKWIASPWIFLSLLLSSSLILSLLLFSFHCPVHIASLYVSIAWIHSLASITSPLSMHPPHWGGGQSNVSEMKLIIPTWISKILQWLLHNKDLWSARKGRNHLENSAELCCPLPAVILAGFVILLLSPVVSFMKCPPHSMIVFLSSMRPDIT